MDENEISSSISISEQIPAIKARFSNNSILIDIYCHTQKGLLAKIITEIEKRHLFVSDINASSINGGTLQIIIVSQMEPTFNMSQQDFLNDLHSIF
ncbi:hypothetical protein BVRB_6g139520 [Beta vulgaris subsp. vulgaris]|nr:hypothetical protein BVRB_6g139520 [Beta vulgaris subsp. vulgaris]